jgi:predicted ATPase
MDQTDGRPHERGARLVVVSGCSGGGKSTLLATMASRGYATMAEPGREVVREQLASGGDGLPWRNLERFVALCVARAAHFHDAAPGDGWVLFDRSIVDAVSALAQRGLAIPPPLRRALQHYRYAATVFMIPPWPELFATDTERRHSFADAVAEYRWLLRSYPANGYAVIEIPKLGIAQRADFLEHSLAAMVSRS